MSGNLEPVVLRDRNDCLEFFAGKLRVLPTLRFAQNTTRSCNLDQVSAIFVTLSNCFTRISGAVYHTFFGATSIHQKVRVFHVLSLKP